MKNFWTNDEAKTSGGSSKRLLIPVDLDWVKNSRNALQFVGAMAGDLSVQATLLYVIPLNTAPVDRRIERELGEEYGRKLRELARLGLSQCPAVSCRLRLGRPHEEIAAEAVSDQSDLIVLSPPKLSPWSRLLRSRTAERVAREAPCFTLMLPRTWKITPEQYRQVMRSQNETSRQMPKRLSVPNQGRFVYQ